MPVMFPEGLEETQDATITDNLGGEGGISSNMEEKTA